MKLCETEIVTLSGGRRSRFAARGTFEGSEGVYTVRYADGADGVTLRVKQGSLRMERANLLAEFRQGERTAVRFGTGEASGEVPAHTELCRVRAEESGLWVRLRYRLAFASGDEFYTLKIAVKVISEEE